MSEREAHRVDVADARSVEVPVAATDGTPTGRTLVVPKPAPDVWHDDLGNVLELRRVAHVERFGCGCIREERLTYVPASTARPAPHRESTDRKVQR